MLRVPYQNSIYILFLSLFVGGAVFAQQLTNPSKSDPWAGPSAEKEKAIEAWATKSLAKPEALAQPGTTETQPEEPKPFSPPSSSNPSKPAELNPFAAQPIQPMAGDRYGQAPGESAPSLPAASDNEPTTPAKEVVRYDAQDSLNVSLRSESKDSFEESPSSNPLRSAAPATNNSLREPSSSGYNSTPAVSNPPSDAARMAFSAPEQEKQPAPVDSIPMGDTQSITAPIAKIHMDQPVHQPTQTSIVSATAAEPRPFNPPVSQPTATTPNERSVLMDTKVASRHSMPASSSNVAKGTNWASEPSSNPSNGNRQTSTAMEVMPVAQGTGKPGDARLEGPQTPGIRIEKRGPNESRVGQPCRFVISVRNTGTQTAKNVTLRDEVPEGSRLQETVPAAEQSGTGLAWNLGTLHPGEERSVEMRVVPEKQGTLGSVATVSFDASASAKTICTKPEIALRLSSPSKVMVGKKQPIKIDVHNPGTGTATGVVLIEEVPTSMRHEAGASLEMEIGTLAPGETRHLDLMLTAEEAGTVVNRLTAVADGSLRVEQSVSFEVVSPALAVSVDGPKRRYLERPASYTVSIDNPGTAPAKDVRIVTQLPRGLKFVRANNLGEYDAASHSVYWSLAELPEGERGAVQVVALPVSAGDHILQVSGESSEGLKATDSKQLSVEGVVSLSFDIRDRQDPIEVGSDAVYDVVVTNEGTKSASNVRVTIQAPTGMQVVDAQGKVGHQVQGGYVAFAPVASLAPNEKYPFRVRLRGVQAGDQRVSVSVESDDLAQPIRREESTRVFGDE